MTSEMGCGAAAISCTQAVILKQGFECYRHRDRIGVGHGDAARTDRLGQPAEASADDRASASNALKRDDAEWLRPS